MKKDEYIKMTHLAHKYASQYHGKEYERSYKDYIKGYEDAHALCSLKSTQIAKSCKTCEHLVHQHGYEMCSTCDSTLNKWEQRT